MKSTWLIDELRTATAPAKESDLPRAVRFWANRTACLNRDMIVEEIRKAVEEGKFRSSRLPFFGRRIEAELPLSFYCDLIGEARSALRGELEENAELLKELGFTLSPDYGEMTLTSPVKVTPKGRELVGGEFIHTYTFSLACRMMLKVLAVCLKQDTRRRPRFRIELRRRVDAPSCFVHSGKKFKNDSISGYPASVHVFYSVRF